MATLKDIRPSITQMDDQEAFNLIKETRFLRRQTPPKKVRAKAKASTRKKPTNPKEMVQKMSKKQKLQLLKELIG